MGKQLQFELWQECNSLCKFCYLGRQNRHTPVELKINSLDNTLNKISDLSLYPEFDTISYLGGQFFQGQLKNDIVKQKFFALMEKTAWLLQNNYIKKFWLYATLTIGDQKDLYDTLTIFKDCPGQIWILTSYDTYGRFHTKLMEQNWKYHMKHIHQLYPDIKFNITTILSNDCITKYLNNQLSFKQMMKQYNAQFFFKQCGATNDSKQETIKELPDFFPTRANFIKFLKKFRLQQSDDMWNKLFNIYYRADVLYRNFNDKDKQMSLNIRHKNSVQQVQTGELFDTLTNTCGHLLTYAAYKDCSGCVICDKHAIEQIYG